MTAPGQEPDEAMTAQPEDGEEAPEYQGRDAVGDNHMPKDVQPAGSPDDGGGGTEAPEDVESEES